MTTCETILLPSSLQSFLNRKKIKYTYREENWSSSKHLKMKCFNNNRPGQCRKEFRVRHACPSVLISKDMCYKMVVLCHMQDFLHTVWWFVMSLTICFYLYCGVVGAIIFIRDRFLPRETIKVNQTWVQIQVYIRFVYLEHEIMDHQVRTGPLFNFYLLWNILIYIPTCAMVVKR